MILKKLLLFTFAFNAFLVPTNVQANNRTLLALITTAMAFTGLATFSSNTCAFYDNADKNTQKFICQGNAIITSSAFLMTACALCLYCKKQYNKRMMRSRLVVNQINNLANPLIEEKAREAV